LAGGESRDFAQLILLSFPPGSPCQALNHLLNHVLSGPDRESGPEMFSRPISLRRDGFPSCPQNIQQPIHKKLKFSENFWLQRVIFGSIVGLKAKGSRTWSRADRTALGPKVRGEGGPENPSLRGTASLRANRSRDRQLSGSRSPDQKAFGPRDPGPRRPRARRSTGRERSRALRFGGARPSGRVSKGPGGLRANGSGGTGRLRADRSVAGKPSGAPADRARQPSGNLVRGWQAFGRVVQRITRPSGQGIRRVGAPSGNPVRGWKAFGRTGRPGEATFGEPGSGTACLRADCPKGWQVFGPVDPAER